MNKRKVDLKQLNAHRFMVDELKKCRGYHTTTNISKRPAKAFSGQLGHQLTQSFAWWLPAAGRRLRHFPGVSDGNFLGTSCRVAA